MDTDIIVQVAVFVVTACALRLTAATLRKTPIAPIFAIMLCCVGAYCTGYALEIFLLQITGIVPVQLWWLLTWSVLAITAFVIAEATDTTGWFAMIPCCIVGVLMALQGPWLADPFSGLRLGQYGVVVSNLSIAGGMAMVLISVPAGLLVGTGRTVGAGKLVPTPSMA